MLYLATSVSTDVHGVPVACAEVVVAALVEVPVLTVDVDVEVVVDDVAVLLAVALVLVHSKQLAS